MRLTARLILWLTPWTAVASETAMVTMDLEAWQKQVSVPGWEIKDVQSSKYVGQPGKIAALPKHWFVFRQNPRRDSREGHQLVQAIVEGNGQLRAEIVSSDPSPVSRTLCLRPAETKRAQCMTATSVKFCDAYRGAIGSRVNKKGRVTYPRALERLGQLQYISPEQRQLMASLGSSRDEHLAAKEKCLATAESSRSGECQLWAKRLGATVKAATDYSSREVQGGLIASAYDILADADHDDLSAVVKDAKAMDGGVGFNEKLAERLGAGTYSRTDLELAFYPLLQCPNWRRSGGLLPESPVPGGSSSSDQQTIQGIK